MRKRNMPLEAKFDDLGDGGLGPGVELLGCELGPAQEAEEAVSSDSYGASDEEHLAGFQTSPSPVMWLQQHHRLALSTTHAIGTMRWNTYRP